MAERLRRSISSDIPSLGDAASYFFRRGAEGKRLRSTVLLLMSSAISADVRPDADRTEVDELPPFEPARTLRRRQQRLTEISELIHVATLLHDDVIDGAETRRGKPALNRVVGNKVAILAGDFLLARASVTLAALRDPEVIALVSRCLEHLVSGEIMQLTATADDSASMEHYLRKTYSKTGALIANCCRSVAILGDATPDQQQAAWDYGRHLGIAFQLVDDVLDYVSSEDELGKPAHQDLEAGLATAPALYALDERPDLLPILRRRFCQPGDAQKALEIVQQTKGIERARQAAAEHAALACKALERLPTPTVPEAIEAREALVELTQLVLSRKK